MSTKASQDKSNTRMVHVRLPERIHRRLRIQAAKDDVTIQEWVVDAIKVKLEQSESEPPNWASKAANGRSGADDSPRKLG